MHQNYSVWSSSVPGFNVLYSEVVSYSPVSLFTIDFLQGGKLVVERRLVNSAFIGATGFVNELRDTSVQQLVESRLRNTIS